MKIYNNSEEIDCLDKWFKLCLPKGGAEHWKDGHSAKEMAKFWLDENKTKDFQEFLQKAIPDFAYDFIIPEACAKFDEFSNPRKHDLFIAEKNKKTIITIEGKADEPFGSGDFEKEFIKSIMKKSENPKSKKMDRMINLYLSNFQGDSDVLKIRYQLLYWFAGSLADAKENNADNFIMVLQEFKSGKANSKNHIDFQEFIEFISEGKYKGIEDKQIIGPIKNGYTDEKNLYIGYYSSELGKETRC